MAELCDVVLRDAVARRGRRPGSGAQPRTESPALSILCNMSGPPRGFTLGEERASPKGGGRRVDLAARATAPLAESASAR